MKRIYVLTLLTLFLQVTLFSQSNFDECTIGAASGSATSDGRPLIWKTRDYSSAPDNEVKYITGYNINYICVANAGSSYYSWMGVNEYGFAILNSLVYDLTGGSGPGNATVMSHALGNCVTVDDFQDYLDATNITGRSTTANFAVLDSNGNAAIFEVAGDEYWKFDAEDAPDGYIIRTNFSIHGGGDEGMDRYIRSSELVEGFYAGDSLNYRSLIRYHMRDFSDAASQPYPVPFLGQIFPTLPYGYFPTQYSICRNTSVSSSVIRGLLSGENAELSTLWAMLGHPAAAITVPYWPVGETPSVSNSTPTAPLCDIALDIKDLLFDFSSAAYINSFLLRDTTGGGLWTYTFPEEDMILDNAEVMLDQWRDLDSIPVAEMLSLENDLAEMAYNELVECYSIITGVDEPEFAMNELNIYPNPANNAFSIDLQPGVKGISIEIMDMQGKVMLHQKLPENHKSFNISNYPKGFYVVRIQTSKGMEVEKLIVQ